MIEKVTHIADVVAAGAFGAIASLPFHKDVDTLPKRVFCVAISAVGASYVTPLVAEYFHLDVNKLAGLGFLVGLFGLSFVQACMIAFQNADLWGVIKSRFGARE
jgi:paired small multidrug resistance pump